MRDIALLTAVGIILFMSTGVTGPISSLYAESLGASYVAIGLLGTVTSIATIVFSYVWGRASDAAGQRKAFLIASLGTMALSYGAMAAVPSYGWLFPLRVAGAVAQSGYGTTSLALMGDLLERLSQGEREGARGTRGRRMGTFRGLGSLGFGVMAFLSGTIADRFSLRVPYALAALLLSAACGLALGVRELSTSGGRDKGGPARRRGQPMDDAREAPAEERDSDREASGLTERGSGLDRSTPVPERRVPSLPLVPLLIAAFLWSLAIGGVYAVWANYMVGELGYSRESMARLWALASTSELPLMILAGWLADRLGRLPMLSAAFLAWTLVFVGYIVAPMMPWIVGIQLVRGFAYSAFTATAMTYATEVRSREQRGRASGMYGTAGGVGSIIGSLSGGTLTQFAGFRPMIATNAALMLGGAVYLAVEAGRHRAGARKQALSP
jgi:MFS family permease